MMTAQESDYHAALAVAPYRDERLVRVMTAQIMAAGHSLLQIFRFALDERGHVARLLEIMSPPLGARVLDAGCGVGEVARLMSEGRPDLVFTLVNISPAQMDFCPDFDKRIGDIEALPCQAGEFDVVMINYALGHGRVARVLPEAFRVLAPGGRLFVYDIAADDPSRQVALLGYRPHPEAEVIAAALAAGFALDQCFMPDVSAETFDDVMEPETFAHVFAGIRPVIYRFTKP